jgi:polyphosphate kinase 2 (PPK2 family)
MSKKGTDRDSHGHAPAISTKAYKDSLRHLQVELVKLQRHFIKCNDKILIILEGRDVSGKDGTIKRIVQHLSPRETRVVALGKSSDDIGKAEQKRRLRDRTTDPLKQWTVSPIDDKAIKHWKAYSLARNEMLARSHTPTAPWTLVRANDKRLARLNIIKDLLGRLHYAGKDKRLIRPDPQIVFAYDISSLANGQLAK